MLEFRNGIRIGAQLLFYNLHKFSAGVFQIDSLFEGKGTEYDVWHIGFILFEFRLAIPKR
jgi:hypothetical protein